MSNSDRKRRKKMTVVLYQDPISAPCRAVIMAAEHLGIKLELKHVNTATEEQMKPEFLAINPQHCVPTIDDDGFILWNSHAIMAYLADKYAPDNPVYPKDLKQRAIVNRLLYFDDNTLTNGCWDYFVPIMFEGKPPDPEKEKSLKNALELLEKFLENTKYVAADHLTLADFSIIATIASIEKLCDYSLEPYPKISAWVKKMQKDVPNYEKINEVPINETKEYLKSQK